MSDQALEQRTPAQQLAAQIRSDTFKQQVAMALPPTVTPERFVRIATTALLANPDIGKLDHQSVLTAMVRAAADGLMPDGKEAAITPRGGKAVYVPMITGFRKIAAEHGWTLRTAVVYANDEFRHAVIDGEEAIYHAPVRPGAERGDLIAAYAIAKHRDGRRMQVVLHPDDIAARRASASTEQVWESHPAAMWEKSAGRDLFAQLGLGELDERVTSILAASNTEPAEATRAMYGDPPAQLPPGEGTHALDGEVVKQPEQPGQDDEPSLGESLNDDERALIEQAAREAAMFMPPNGKHKDKTLSEIAAMADGDGWLRWALRKDDLATPYSQAVWSFCRIYKPGLFQQVLAEKEAQAAA